MTTQNTQSNTQGKPTKTKAEIVRAMQREFTEIESITENIKELKDEAKAAGYDATMLAKLAKAMAEAKTDEIIEKSEAFIELAEQVRSE
jgi:uncharacterized protein (UPF0335 family)